MRFIVILLSFPMSICLSGPQVRKTAREVFNSGTKVNCYQNYALGSLLCFILYCALQPFSQGYNLTSHTTYVVCVNFIHKRQNLQFKVDSQRKFFFFFGNFSWHLYLLSELFARNLLSKSCLSKIFFIFLCLTY